MDCRVLSIPWNYCISILALCDVFWVLTWISSSKDESSISGKVSSLCLFICCSHLSAVAALKDCTNRGGVSSEPRKNLTAESPPNLSLNVL